MQACTRAHIPPWIAQLCAIGSFYCATHSMLRVFQIPASCRSCLAGLPDPREPNVTGRVGLKACTANPDIAHLLTALSASSQHHGWLCGWPCGFTRPCGFTAPWLARSAPPASGTQRNYGSLHRLWTRGRWSNRPALAFRPLQPMPALTHRCYPLLSLTSSPAPSSALLLGPCSSRLCPCSCPCFPLRYPLLPVPRPTCALCPAPLSAARHSARYSGSREGVPRFNSATGCGQAAGNFTLSVNTTLPGAYLLCLSLCFSLLCRLSHSLNKLLWPQVRACGVSS